MIKKDKRNKSLTDREKKFNKLISETRFKVKRRFGNINRWFSGGRARYRGLEKTHTQNLMKAICHNLYRVSRNSWRLNSSHRPIVLLKSG